jgi:hypothetical protein
MDIYIGFILRIYFSLIYFFKDVQSMFFKRTGELQLSNLRRIPNMRSYKEQTQLPKVNNNNNNQHIPRQQEKPHYQRRRLKTRMIDYIKSTSTSTIDSQLGASGRGARRTCKTMPSRRETPPSFVCLQSSKPRFHLARQMDGGRNNASIEVRYIQKMHPLSAR